jgi:hypothetical protein
MAGELPAELLLSRLAVFRPPQAPRRRATMRRNVDPYADADLACDDEFGDDEGPLWLGGLGDLEDPGMLDGDGDDDGSGRGRKVRGSYNCGKCGLPKRGHGACQAGTATSVTGRLIARPPEMSRAACPDCS